MFISRTYRQRTAQDETPLRRRASGMALAVGINLLLLLALISAGVIPTEMRKASRAIVVELIRGSDSPAPRPTVSKAARPVPRPPIVLPVKPSIAPDHKLAMIELTSEEFAAADISKLPKSEPGAGKGGAGDSQEVGRGPNGEVLYAAEWAHPTLRLSGYLPPNAPELGRCLQDHSTTGRGLRLSRQRASDRIPAGRPPRARCNPRRRAPGTADFVGEWVQIRIDYIRAPRRWWDA
jgi:protein TonB